MKILYIGTYSAIINLVCHISSCITYIQYAGLLIYQTSHPVSIKTTDSPQYTMNHLVPFLSFNKSSTQPLPKVFNICFAIQTYDVHYLFKLSFELETDDTVLSLHKRVIQLLLYVLLEKRQHKKLFICRRGQLSTLCMLLPSTF